MQQTSSHRPQRTAAHRENERTLSVGNGARSAAGSASAHLKSSVGDKMGGLALPDVVRELLRDPSVLKWHSRDEVYEVMHGETFEKRWDRRLPECRALAPAGALLTRHCLCVSRKVKPCLCHVWSLLAGASGKAARLTRARRTGSMSFGRSATSQRRRARRGRSAGCTTSLS